MQNFKIILYWTPINKHENICKKNIYYREVFNDFEISRRIYL